MIENKGDREKSSDFKVSSIGYMLRNIYICGSKNILGIRISQDSFLIGLYILHVVCEDMGEKCYRLFKISVFRESISLVKAGWNFYFKILVYCN